MKLQETYSLMNAITHFGDIFLPCPIDSIQILENPDGEGYIIELSTHEPDKLCKALEGTNIEVTDVWDATEDPDCRYDGHCVNIKKKGG